MLEKSTFDRLVNMAADAGAAGFVLGRAPDNGRRLSTTKDSGSSERVNDEPNFVDDGLALVEKRKVPERACPSPQRPKQTLTDRENSIIEFIAGGKSNKEIARALGVTPETIKTHVKRIFSKLSAASRAQAAVQAQSLGLLRGI